MNNPKMSPHKKIHPPDWARPSGFTPGIVAEGKLVFVAGQVGWDNTNQVFQSDDLVDQIDQALLNTAAVISEAGGEPENIVRMIWYVLDVAEYKERRKEIGRVYRKTMGRHFPAIAVVEINGLVEDRAKFEVESTAVVSPP